MVLCECVCKVRADEAGPAGDDVAHEEVMAAAGLGVSELNWGIWSDSVRISEERYYRIRKVRDNKH